MDARLVFAAAVLAVGLVAAVLLAHHGGAPSGGSPAAAASPAAACGAAGVQACRPVSLVIVGTMGCPHCRAMRAWLPGLGYPVLFCDISRPRCGSVFARLYSMHVADAVPVIGACLGGRLLFIEVGELRDPGWWRARLGEGAAAAEGVPVYVGGRLAMVLVGDAAREVARLLCVEAAGAAQPADGG